MNCRPGCGACCIGLSISSPIPGMPRGKPAGVRCIQLTGNNLCRIFGQADRPEVCVRLRPNEEMCGKNADEALAYLDELERATRPAGGRTKPSLGMKDQVKESVLPSTGSGRTDSSIKPR